MATKRAPSTRSTKKTSSRKPGRARKPLRPFTVDHFRAYARNLVLDDGSNWEPEDFQLFAVEDLFEFNGPGEVWLVVPEGNGKTTLMAGVCLYHADYTESAAVVLGAASRDQCLWLHRQAAGFVRRTPGLLDKRFGVFDGYRQIRALRTGGYIQVFAADDRTGDGVIPSLALLEELHRHRDLRLYRTWRGKLDKRGAQLGVISTAGEIDSEFEKIRKRLRTEATDVKRKGAHTRAASEGAVLHDWAVPADGDPEDIELVKAANPLSTITTQSLERKRGSVTMSLTHWLRFVCNRPVQEQEAAISEREWMACFDAKAEIPEGSVGPVVNLDLAWKWDTTAIVPLLGEGEGEELQITVGETTIIVPPRDGTSISDELIKDVLRDYDERWSEITAVLDPQAGGEQLAQWIERELGWRVIAHSQKPQPMALAAQRLLEVVKRKALRHPGDPDLTRHVLAAAAKPVGEGFKLVKPKTGACIDGGIALAIGVSHVIGEGGTSVYQDTDLLVLS
jgi:phage terminase large subunit-like protein